jgi:hypothetical protein
MITPAPTGRPTGLPEPGGYTWRGNGRLFGINAAIMAARPASSTTERIMAQIDHEMREGDMFTSNRTRYRKG